MKKILFFLLLIIYLEAECFYPMSYRFDDKSFFPLALTIVDKNGIEYEEIILSDAQDRKVGISNQLPAIYQNRENTTIGKIKKHMNLKYHKFLFVKNKNDISIYVYENKEEFLLFLFIRGMLSGSITLSDSTILHNILNSIEVNKICNKKRYEKYLGSLPRESLNQRLKYLISLYLLDHNPEIKKKLIKLLKSKNDINSLTIANLKKIRN